MINEDRGRAVDAQHVPWIPEGVRYDGADYASRIKFPQVSNVRITPD